MSAHNEPVPYEDLGSYRPPNDDKDRPPRGRSDEREQVSLEEHMLLKYRLCLVIILIHQIKYIFMEKVVIA